MDADIEALVRGLTKAQREFIVDGREDPRGWHAVFYALCAKGMFDRHPALTPLGLRVRDALLSERES